MRIYVKSDVDCVHHDDVSLSLARARCSRADAYVCGRFAARMQFTSWIGKTTHKSHSEIHLIRDATLGNLILTPLAFHKTQCSAEQKDDSKCQAKEWKKRCWLCNQVYFVFFHWQHQKNTFNKFSFIIFMADVNRLFSFRFITFFCLSLSNHFLQQWLCVPTRVLAS